ncbi:MAG: hypothetical protein IKZ06_04145 [Oscillospiraceae bacterium]|nr:hypothetical protein [Oscillospiraceae bacterium]
MAEHDFEKFEHDFAEKLKALDAEIKVPEIPDAQSIFEKAEIQKPKVIPFKKYSGFVAAAAAVVLICISLPIFMGAGAAESAMPLENLKAFDDEFSFFTTDAAEPVAEVALEESAEEPAEYFEEEVVTEAETETIIENSCINSLRIYDSLYEVFYGVQSSSASSTVAGMEEYKDAPTSDSVKVIEGSLNKKRSIEIEIEEGSVSVRLFDDSSAREIISAFWVEGIYQASYLDGEKYIINLSYKISFEDFESRNYIPMAGDPENGTYLVSADNTAISENVSKGVISMVIELDIGTGEYKIYGTLE